MSTVMVTGVGAIMGYGLLKSLRASDPAVVLVGTDIYDDAAGRAWCDAFAQAPLTASADYPAWLERVIRQHAVDLVIPGIEQDLHWFSDHREQVAQLGCGVVLNSRALIDLSRDKWAMDQALAAADEPARIPSYLSGSFAELAQTLGLVWVQSASDFEPHAHLLGEVLMAQPIIGCAEQEFTVAVFGDGEGGSFGSITLQRKLAADGSTAKAWVRQEASLDEVVARLCAHFRPVGPTNLQFRRDADGSWKLLEINPRISSTSSMRRAFGYNEAAMCLDFFLNRKAPPTPEIRPGFAVRYIEELVVHDRDDF
jgi:carbamoyl-phosphate synthase large subunit